MTRHRNVEIPPTDISVCEFVNGYTPTHLDVQQWNAVASVVRATGAASAPTVTMARRILPVVAGYAAWAQREGYAVTLPLLRDSGLMDRYVESGMGHATDSTRATRRAILRLVATRLDPCPPPAPEAIAYRRVKPPYAEWEINRYYAAAFAQPTQARVWSSLSMLTLGLGCGLDRSDLAWVRGVDIEPNVSDPTVWVTVTGGPRPRTVIALDDYGDLLLRCADIAGEQLVIGGRTLGRHNVTTPALDRMVADSRLPRLSTSRLRSTWLVRHLDLGTPLSVLLPAAGLKSSRTLDDLVEYSTPIPAHRAGPLLRGRPA